MPQKNQGYSVMRIFKADFEKMKLVPLFLVFFLFFPAKHGIAGGEGKAKNSQNCIEHASEKKDTCLISIIVELDLSVEPDVDKNEPQRVRTVSGSIQSAQDAVLKSLEGENTANVRRYKLLPFLGIATDGNGIMKILSVPQVRAVVLDREIFKAGKVMKAQ